MRKCLLAALLVLLPGLAVGQEFIKYYPPAGLSTMSGTATATTTTVPILFPDGVVGAPAISFASDPDTGFYLNGTTLRYAVGGIQKFFIDTNGSMGWAVNDVAVFGDTSNMLKSIYMRRFIQGSSAKTLTDAAAAASVVRIAVATNSYIGGKIIWTATSTDATDQLTTSGEQFFSGVDKAGTVTCGTGAAVGTATAYTTAKTLVCTVTVATSTTNCDIQASCTNDTVGSQNVIFNWRLDMPLTATVTPQ